MIAHLVSMVSKKFSKVGSSARGIALLLETSKGFLLFLKPQGGSFFRNRVAIYLPAFKSFPKFCFCILIFFLYF